MGIGFLPEIVIASELKKRQFAVLNWQAAKMSMETSIVWHKDRWVSPAMQAFLNVVIATQQQTGTPTLLRERAC
jgi:DNA-binding transcriptional LysR family regulator